MIIAGLGGIIVGKRIDPDLYFLFPVLGVIWIIGCYTLGFWNEHFGFWGHQNIHLTKSKGIQPIFKELIEDIKEIKNKVGGFAMPDVLIKIAMIILGIGLWAWIIYMIIL